MNPILLLHGALGAESQLEIVKKQLQQKLAEVYTLNFSGHGGEPFKSTFGIECFTSDVLEFLDQNQLNQVDIFGYSMGGYVASWLALTHSERIGKIVTLGTKFDWSIESAEKETKKLDADKILEKIPAFARILESRHSPNDWKVLIAKTKEMMLSLGRYPLLNEENLKAIKNKIIVCLGDEDDMADLQFSKKVAEVLPNGTFELFLNTKHPIEKVDVDLILNQVTS
jgi:pimeloyl-ACP methyl ester carboxylesterase